MLVVLDGGFGDSSYLFICFILFWCVYVHVAKMFFTTLYEQICERCWFPVCHIFVELFKPM